jgi:hypothetical protein
MSRSIPSLVGSRGCIDRRVLVHDDHPREDASGLFSSAPRIIGAGTDLIITK